MKLPFVSGLPHYDPTWESLDSRPLPNWYDESKFGIFLHWGVFSVPSYGSEWFWWYWEGDHPNEEYADYVGRTETDRFHYTDYAPRFDATLYEPTRWANLFAQSGAQYVVLTSKHHEGYCNWDSRDVPATWNWNSYDVGPRRDLVGELSVAVRDATSPHTDRPLRFGLYHSLFEWFNPLYLRDVRNNLTTTDFVDEKTMPELYDLVSKYEPEVIWSDGDAGASSDYWKSKEFLAWLANNSTIRDTVVWNDRWGPDSMCRHGSFLTCSDRYIPDKVVTKKWENCYTIDRTSWGLNRNASLDDYLSTKELIHVLIETVAFNGNLLLNVGPAADGTIHPIFQDRLRGIGSWLAVNGRAIYGTTTWSVCSNETSSSSSSSSPPIPVFYTRDKTRSDRIYAHFTEWPQDNGLLLDCPTATSNLIVSFLGLDDDDDDGGEKPHFLSWTERRRREEEEDDGEGRNNNNNNGSSKLAIELPPLTPRSIPCEHAWVLSLEGIEDVGRIDPDDDDEEEEEDDDEGEDVDDEME